MADLHNQPQANGPHRGTDALSGTVETPGGSPVARSSATALPGGTAGTPGASPVASTENSASLIKRHGANLPHWRKDGSTYAVTFHLADSLPTHVLREWRGERMTIIDRAKQMGRPLAGHEVQRLTELHSQRVEEWLDRGHGSCALRDPGLAELVRGAMRHFDGQRYDLLAWCIMPNHVHAVLSVYSGRDLSGILLSWKGFTGKKAREITQTIGAGAFWQKESYDHLVRDEKDLAHQIRYVLQNPVRAKLIDWCWVWSAEGATALPGGDV